MKLCSSVSASVVSLACVVIFNITTQHHIVNQTFPSSTPSEVLHFSLPTSNSTIFVNKSSSIPKLVKYNADDSQARATLVPAAIDFWSGSDINYWDRKAKYRKMMANPHTFYRGTAQLYWYDLGLDERLQRFGGTQDTATWLCGDYHVENAGSFQQDGQVIYGLSDFDESVFADYQLDLWRLAVNIVLIARINKNLKQDEVTKVLDAMSSKYIEMMRHFRTHKSAVTEPLTVKNTYGKMDNFLSLVEKNYSRDKLLNRWAPEGKDGVRRFDLSLRSLGSVTAQEKQAIQEAMESYWTTLHGPVDPKDYAVLDISRRLLAGVGSLGLDRFYVLLQDNATDVVRILDVKQQEKPAPYDHMGTRSQQIYNEHATEGNHAKVVTTATLKLSLKPDPFCGWMKLSNGKYYSVTERNPYKRSYPALIEDVSQKEYDDLAL